MPTTPVVVLFKSPDEDADVDPYTTVLHAVGLESLFIPVLKYQSVNDALFDEKLKAGPEGNFGGVIVTSSRAAEMWINAAERCSESSEGADWRTIPFYVVGQKTARALSSSTLPEDSSYHPSDIRGAESGTGAKLAEFILSNYANKDDSSPSTSTLLPLLYLIGDKNAGTLLRTLEEDGRVTTRTLQVYRTWTREDHELEEDFRQLRDKVDAGLPFSDLWLVFFAPSGAKALLPLARRHFPLRSSSSFPSAAVSSAQGPVCVRLGAIGPTTASYLTSEEHLAVDVVPDKPTPDDLARSIASHVGRA